MLFDSHTHLNNENYTDADRQALMDEIEGSDVSYVMDIGFDLASSLQAIKDAQSRPWCFAAVGVHPHDAKTLDEETFVLLKGLAKKDKVQAIGEIGLDYYCLLYTYYRLTTRRERITIIITPARSGDIFPTIIWRSTAVTSQRKRRRI